MTRRLLLGFMTFAAVVLLLLMVPLGVANQRSERTDLTRRLERDAVAAAALSQGLVRPAGAALPASGAAPDVLRERLRDYASQSEARVVVVDADGRSILDTGEPGREVELARDFSTRPEVATALSGKVESGQRGSDTLGHPLLFVAVPITTGGAALGAVRLSYPAAELDERIERYWLTLASVSLAVLGVAALVGVLLARWIAQPLDAIAAVADDVGRGELGARADDLQGPPEVRAVAAGLNASVDSIEHTLRDQRAFTADASHQLRTPLHALTLRLDNVAHDLEHGDAAGAAQDVERATIEVERLAALVESLLVLERADRLADEPVGETDLAAVVAARLPAWGERAQRAGITLLHDVPDQLMARARPVHAEQVLDNYIDNALSATPVGRTVRVVGASVDDGAAVELHVVDEGPGMPADQLEDAFRRFRSGADRPVDAGRGGGFGLGLAIVRRLAEVDGGHAWLRPGPGRGIDAVVRYEAQVEHAGS